MKPRIDNLARLSLVGLSGGIDLVSRMRDHVGLFTNNDSFEVNEVIIFDNFFNFFY